MKYLKPSVEIITDLDLISARPNVTSWLHMLYLTRKPTPTFVGCLYFTGQFIRSAVGTH